jgi:hypothetical protein
MAMMNGKNDRDDQRQILLTHAKSNLCECFFQKEVNQKIDTLPRIILSICTLMLLCVPIYCLPNLAVAADWRLIPKIGVAGGYDDNIFFSKDNKVDSSTIAVRPGLELDYETLLTKLKLTADVEILNYPDESDLNRFNQYYLLDANHRLGERWDTRVGFRFKDDSTLNTYLEEVGRVIERIDRQYYYAAAGISYNISTVSSIDTDYSYETVRYEDDLFPEYDAHRLNLYYRHRLKTQQDTLTVGPSFYHRSNDINDTDYISLDIGWERDWSDITNTFAAIGARYTNVEDQDGNDDNDWGARAKFDLTHQGIQSKISFRYYHDLATTADGTDVNVDNFFLGYDFLLTARFGAGINGRLVFSYDLFNSADDVDDRRYYALEPFLYYQLTKNFNLYLRYSYQNSSDDIIDSENTVDKNSAWIELRYELPMML